MIVRCRVAGLVAAVVGWVAPLSAQGGAATGFVPGSLSEQVVSIRDSRQRYAVFVPSRYDSLHPRPLLCLMDPRGRALIPLRLLRPAAERFGYIVFSSYDTRSDEPGDPNEAAVNAMIADAQRLFAIDTRRIYLAGFSGTARAGWDYAYRLDGHIAGLLGFGAGFPPGWTPPVPAPGEPGTLVFYGGAGTTDFNYQEVQDLDAYLEQRGIRHHVASYDGPHGWPPESVMSDGLQWMELQAMRRGLVPRDSAWVDSLYSLRSAGAAAADSAGDRYTALLAYHAVRDDFAGLHDVTPDSARAVALTRTAKVRRALEHRAEIAERHRAYLGTLRRFIARTRESHEQQKLSQSLKELQIMRLVKQAADTGDRSSALGAAQLLEQVFVVTAFYEPREALAGGNPARALGLLDIAEAIHPGSPFVCASRKEVLEKLGRAAEADAIRCPSS
jgi:predicted esterase